MREQRAPAAIDAAFLLALCVLALLGFQSAFGGVAYLLAGTAAVVIGILIAQLSIRLRISVLSDAVLTVVVFVLAGGAVAGTGGGPGHVLPSVQSIGAVLGVAVQGWKVLLTTAPPVGDSGHLLAIPFLLGLVAGVAGYAVSRRTRLVAVPAAAPASVLVLGILFGTAIPVALLAQGSLFTALLLVWLPLRQRRSRPPSLTGTSRRLRAGSALTVVVVAAVVASLVGPNLPFSNPERTVLSRYVVPPFNANDLASPLSSYRRYAPGSPRSLATTTLFTVSGVEPSTLVTLATMDAYDGLAWGFGGEGTARAASGGGDVFRRYGSNIPAAAPGARATLQVTVAAWSGVFVPSVGEVTGATFGSQDAATLGQNFVYDATTQNAAVTSGLSSGDSYTLHVLAKPSPSPAALAGATAGSNQLRVEVPAQVQTAATAWIKGAAGAWAKVMAIASSLKDGGRLSDGTEDPPLASAGHSAGRLAEFVSGDPSVDNPLVGDDEQFAATLALASNAVGVPSRVVFGAEVEPGGLVKGKDVHAWVEVSLEGLGWVTVAPDLFRPTQSAKQPLPQPEPQQLPQASVPPPTVSDLRPPAPHPLQANPQAVPETSARKAGVVLPGWLVTLLVAALSPLALVAAVLVAIVAAKARRRHRRRVAGPPSARITGGWRELLDTARDHGIALPPRRTRRELALTVAVAGAAELAHGADAAVFGPAEATEEFVSGYWRAVDVACAALRRGAAPRRRLLGRFSVRSLRRLRS